MELYQIKTFLKVAELNNITRSAEELNTSQPAVSAHIKALEEELDIKLFNRNSRGMELTERGEKLKGTAEDVLGSVESMYLLAELLRKESNIDVHISTNTYPEALKLNELLSITAKKYPDVNYTFSHGNSAKILRDIRNEVFDCGYIFGKNKYHDIESIKLNNIPLKFIAPYAWKEKMPAMDFGVAAGLPWVFMTEDCPLLMEVNKILNGLSTDLNIAVRVDHENQILNLVESGMGLSLIPEFALKDSEENNRIHVYHDVDINIDLSFVYLKRKEGESQLRMLKELLPLSHKLAFQ